MSEWIEAVEAKARIIHEQLAAAHAIADRNGSSANDIAKPYLDLLSSLYRDEFIFARIMDTSDLVVRFVGPAVSSDDPTVTIVTSLFKDLRDQIRGVAKSIIGLSVDQNIKWPSELDPHLSGLTHGSLAVGIRIHPPDESYKYNQTSVPGVSREIIESIRAAVRSIATVARHVHEDRIDETSIQSEFQDPAIRDTVMVATSKLAPSGRKGIISVALYEPEETGVEAPLLTIQSRKMLNQSLARPVSSSRHSSFEGVVRAIDLDTRRFEIRHVKGIGAIRCMYEPGQQDYVKEALDCRIRVSGNYETMEDQKPRFIAVSSIEMLDGPIEQSNLNF